MSPKTASTKKGEDESTSYFCMICLEDFAEKQTHTNHHTEDGHFIEALTTPQNSACLTLPFCAHKFCADCLLEHVVFAVESKRVPIPCPEILCTTHIPDGLVESLLNRNDIGDDKIHAKRQRITLQWNRQQQLAETPTMIECTACTRLIETQFAGAAGIKIQLDDLQCPHCGHDFCRRHGDIHRGETCASFQASPRGKTFQKSELAVDRCTKPCSHCGARLHKQKGCDYVVCAHCNQDMCYKCGSHEYLTEGRFRHCAKCGGLFEGRHDFAAWMICVLVVLLIAFFLLYPPIALAVVLLTCCCGAGFCLGRGLDPDNPTWAPMRGFVTACLYIVLPCLLLFNSNGEWQDQLPHFWSSNRDPYTSAPPIPVHSANTKEAKENITKAVTQKYGTDGSDSADSEPVVVHRRNTEDNWSQV